MTIVIHEMKERKVKQKKRKGGQSGIDPDVSEVLMHSLLTQVSLSVRL